MSDPVTNVEIEDVLSSIRRLVANGKQDGSALAEPAAAQKAEPANRLVLTPSLRVDDSPATETSGIAPPKDTAPSQDVAEFIQPEREQAPEVHDSVAGDRQDDVDASGDAPEAEAPEHHIDIDHDTAAENEGEDWSLEGMSVSGDAIDHSVEPEDDIWLETAEDKPESDAETDQAAHDDAPHAAKASDAGTMKANEAPSDLEAQAAEFEAVVAKRDDQWEPDGESGDDYAGGTVTPLSWGVTQGELDETDDEELLAALEWDEEDDVDSVRQDQDWPQDAMPVPPVEQWGDNDAMALDEAIIDEEALRDMVSEIVRQELQGALGERITRNVRKLVRREIHRALNSQDMD